MEHKKDKTKYDVLVGALAVKKSSTNLTNTIYDAKRIMGRVLSDQNVQADLKLWPFKLTSSEDNSDKPVIEI